MIKKTILCGFYCRLQGLHISQFAEAEKKMDQENRLSWAASFM